MRRASVVWSIVALGVLAIIPANATAGGASSPSSARVASHAALEAFVSMGQRGISGTFSETYRLVQGLVTTGTVVISQEAPARGQVLAGGSGTWAFRFSDTAGYASQWIERGSTAWDCWRGPSASRWTCSGPGQFHTVNGYLLAIQPYVPGDIEGDISALASALTKSAPVVVKKIVRQAQLFDSTSATFGALRCLSVDGTTTCLDRSGVVVSQTGGSFWTSITLVHRSSRVPKSAFVPMAPSSSLGKNFAVLTQPYFG